MASLASNFPIYFFGCIRQPGHYWWAPPHQNLKFRAPPEIGIPDAWERIDGNFVPEGTSYNVEGHASLLYEDDWTLLAFWDRTIDKRPGSNAAFVARGTLSFDEICDLAKEHFAGVWARFHYSIIHVE